MQSLEADRLTAGECGGVGDQGKLALDEEGVADVHGRAKAPRPIKRLALSGPHKTPYARIEGSSDRLLAPRGGTVRRMGLIRQKNPVHELREPLSIPLLRKQGDQAAQHVTLAVQLSKGAPRPGNETEQVYLGGLQALARNELDVAFDQLRAVVENDVLWVYPSAKLLLLVLYRALGDPSPLTAMMDACLENTPPDNFVHRALATCTLCVSKYAGDGTGIQLAHMLLYPAIAAQLATAGSLPLDSELAERVASLEAALDLATAPWQPRFKGDYSVDAEAARRRLVDELASTVCLDRLILGEPDTALDILGRFSFVGDLYLKAKALADKGLTDAALVAYDGASKDGKKRGRMYQYSARYDKAKVLVAIGDLTRARKELARLYADEPSYTDKDGLLDAVRPGGRSTSRAAIPEDVRHAVWRRDEGRCVQCGSQERLEFDHIIPVSRGGASTERNLQLLCERCNREKSATI